MSPARKRLNRAWRVGAFVAAGWLTGCSGESHDAGAAGAKISQCSAAPADAEELSRYQQKIVGRLSGHDEIAPGVRLPDRYGAEHRRIGRQYLKDLFSGLDMTPQEHDYGTGANVYAELLATSGSNEWMVLGAHFDSVRSSPGANDNATGVALVYAVARRLKVMPCRSRNVLFVLFDEEELGLLGSEKFADKLADEKRHVLSVHTVDQMGWDANGDRLIELERPDVGLHDLYESAVRELGVSIPITVTSTPSSNHSSFRPRFPAVGLTEGYRSGDTTPHYHKPSDRFETVNFAYLASTTTLVTRVLSDQL